MKKVLFDGRLFWRIPFILHVPSYQCDRCKDKAPGEIIRIEQRNRSNGKNYNREWEWEVTEHKIPSDWELIDSHSPCRPPIFLCTSCRYIYWNYVNKVLTTSDEELNEQECIVLESKETVTKRSKKKNKSP